MAAAVPGPEALIQCRRLQSLRADRRASVREARIRAAITKGKLRRVLFIDVPRQISARHVARRPCEVHIAGRASGVEMVVIKRLLPHAARPTDHQFPARIHLAEKRAHQCRPARNTRQPGRNHRRHMFKRPGKSQRPPAEKNQNHRLAGPNNSFQQFLLPARQVPDARAKPPRHSSLEPRPAPE